MAKEWKSYGWISYRGSDPSSNDKISTKEDLKIIAIYTVEGLQVDKPVPGLNIVRFSNGECHKILIEK